MDDATKIVLAPGLHSVRQEDGTIRIEPSGEHKDRTVAFRVTAGQFATEIQPFVESFPERQFATAFRWLLEQPAVRDVMQSRVGAVTTRRR